MDLAALRTMSVKDLRALAESKGVPRPAKLRKDELIQALEPLVCAPAPRAALPAASAPAGSSKVEAKPAAPLPPPEQGLPIPDHYDRDRLVLMVQDPHHLFAYWEVTPATLDRVRAEAGEGWAPVLVLTTPAGDEQREIDLRGGNYYLAVAPGTTYRAVLALRGRDGRLHVLAASSPVTTSAAGPSHSTDEQWMVVDETFQELLSLAGAHAESSGARFSGARFRTRSLDSRILAWGGEGGEGAESGGEAALRQLSSLAVAGPGGPGVQPSSLALALTAQASSHVLAGPALPLGLSSGQQLSSGALSSFSLSSAALSSSSGALVRFFERAAPPAVANGGHAQANAAAPAPGTPAPAPAATSAPAPAASAGAPAAGPGPASAPAANPAPGGPALPPLHRLSGADTIKRVGRKPLPPKAR
jgi:hypothetical protein